MRSTPGLSLTHGLAEALGRAIVAGDYNDEGFPTEGELARQLGASRNVTREAVKMLTAKGLLTARPRHGTTVEPPSKWNLLDPDVLRWLLDRKFSVALLTAFTEMRLAFEPQAAALAARRADAAGRIAIAQAIERMREAAEGRDDHASADMAFHASVLEASGNPFFVQLRELVNTALRISLRATYQVKSLGQSLEDHERAADAILAGDAAGAHHAMEAMMLDVLRQLASLPPEALNGVDQERPARRGVG
jgi:DNA-binding FadR family transcriptional regulator